MEDSSAAFYIGVGPGSRMIAWGSEACAPQDLGGWPMIGASVEPFTQQAFIHYATMCVDEAPDHRLANPLTDGSIDPDTLPHRPRWQYAFVGGSVHVLDRGFFLAQVFPHGGRRRQQLPGVSA